MTLPLTLLHPAQCDPSAPKAVTIGVFDGVHLGHRHLLRQLRQVCAPGEQAMAVMLSAQPREVLGGTQGRWIDDPDERAAKIATLADIAAELRFDASTAALTACQTARLLYQEAGMRTLFIGYDSRFGSLRNDDFLQLPRLAAELGFRLVKGDRFEFEGKAVSSSRIRNAIACGDMGLAARLLDSPYTLRGTVVHGRGVGRGLGFPTANIDLAGCRKMLPPEGVYAVCANGRAAVANLGPQPTFGLSSPTLEVHLIGFDGDLYGQTIGISFRQRLRDTRHFASADELAAQLRTDIQQALQWS